MVVMEMMMMKFVSLCRCGLTGQIFPIAQNLWSFSCKKVSVANLEICNDFDGDFPVRFPSNFCYLVSMQICHINLVSPTLSLSQILVSVNHDIILSVLCLARYHRSDGSSCTIPQSLICIMSRQSTTRLN